MIEVTSSVFPTNVIEVIEIPLKGIDPDIQVFKRPLRNTDPQQSIGIFAQMWDPDEESFEMMGVDNAHPQMPTLQRYVYGIQAFVKDGDEERGLATHAYLAGSIRRVLYTFPPLRVALASLKVEFQDGSAEKLTRWGIRTARYFAGEIDGVNLYLATLEFWVETETRGAQA